MESHRYKKHRGVGPITTKLTRTAKPAPPDAQAADEATLCQHLDARGHRCRMLAAPNGELCAHHAQRLSRSTPANDVLTAELLSSIEDFSTAASVNQFLGNLTKQLVRKRIQRRDAIALAYLSQLLLNSLSAMSREEAQTQREEAQQPLEIIWDNFPQRRVENRLESRVLGDTTTLADPAVAARPENAI
jgi:hypothetical protein